MHYFSKSKLISAWQCQKKLFLEKYRPDLADSDEGREAIFATGHRVSALAQDKYGTANSVEVAFDKDVKRMLSDTRDLIEKGPVAPIFEATFQHEGVLIRADVLTPDADGWHVIEVKSSTTVKDVNVFDCAIQAWVMQGAGLNIKSISLAFIDNQFVYAGDGDYTNLLQEVDVTEQAFALRDDVAALVKTSRETLDGELPEMPVGEYCDKPYCCEFKSTCWPVGSEFPVMGIGGRKRDIIDWVNRGIHDIREIPEEELGNAKRQRVFQATCAGKVECKTGAKQALESLGYPRYYLDFETAGPAVPVWAGTRPYNQMPVQWSIHIDDGKADGTLDNMRHAEFLDLSGEPPMRALAEGLVGNLGGSGPIFMYTNFEERVIRQLAQMFPDLRAPLMQLVDRLYDLCQLARDHYYHPKMLGSWSIKKVAPAMAPHIDYENMPGISDGMAAANGYLEAIDRKTSAARKDEIERELLTYCKLDTVAMVEVVRFFETK